MYTIKELVTNTTAYFIEYRKGNLWYGISGKEGFEFPVPIEDVGDGIFRSNEKGIMLMRYIRKHVDTLQASQN